MVELNNIASFNVINTILFQEDIYNTECKKVGNYTKYAKLSAKILMLLDNRKATTHPYWAIIADAFAEDRGSVLESDVALAKVIGKQLEEMTRWK